MASKFTDNLTRNEWGVVDHPQTAAEHENNAQVLTQLAEALFAGQAIEQEHGRGI